MTRFLSGSLRAALWRRRHLLLAIGLIGAVVGVVEAFRPTPVGVEVVVLTTRIEAGQSITAGDVRSGRSEVVPAGALTAAPDAVGETAAVGLPEGTILSESLLVGGSLADSAPPGTAILPVAVADPGSVLLAQPGATVTLLGTGLDGADADALVLASLPPEQAGVLGAGASELTTLLLAVHTNSISVIADASAVAPLRVALVPSIHSDP